MLEYGISFAEKSQMLNDTHPNEAVSAHHSHVVQLKYKCKFLVQLELYCIKFSLGCILNELIHRNFLHFRDIYINGICSLIHKSNLRYYSPNRPAGSSKMDSFKCHIFHALYLSHVGR